MSMRSLRAANRKKPQKKRWNRASSIQPSLYFQSYLNTGIVVPGACIDVGNDLSQPTNKALKTKLHYPGRIVSADDNDIETCCFPVPNTPGCASAVSFPLLYTSSRTSPIKDNYPPRIKVNQILANFGRTLSGILFELATEEENIAVPECVGYLGNIHPRMKKQMLSPVDPGLDNVGLNG